MYNILHMSNSKGIGGAENVLINLASGLKRDTFYSIVVLIQDGPLNEELKNRGFETFVIKSSLKDFGFFIKLLSIIKKRGIKLIHSHEFIMNVYGTLAGKILNIPVTTTVHGKNYYHEKLRRILAYRYVSRNSKMIAVSNDLNNFLIKEIGINKNRIQTIYNGIDVNKFNGEIKDDQKKAIKARLGINENDFVISNVGNLRPEKGHIFLIQAAEKVIKHYPNTRILLAGRGSCEKELKKEAEKLNITNNIIFLGYKKNIKDILQVSDLFVLPSLSEGLPLSILEAMAAGLPVIASDVGGVSEIIIDNKNGYLIEPGNPSIIAEKILFLIRTKEQKEVFIKSGLEITKKLFSSSQMINKYKELYLSLLNL